MDLLKRGTTEDTQHAVLVLTITLAKTFLYGKSLAGGLLGKHYAKSFILNDLDGMSPPHNSLRAGGSKRLGGALAL
jgi:hypothetical protein